MRRTLKDELNIGKQLESAIKNKGITITQFADEIGMNRSLVQAYLANRKHPSLKRVEVFADYFNLPVEYFTGEPMDADGNDLGFKDYLANLVREKVDEHKINQYFKAALKAASYTFEKGDTDTKFDLTRKIFDAIWESQNEPISSNLTSIEQPEYLRQLYMILYAQDLKDINQAEISQRIVASIEKDRIINQKDWNSYKTGFEDGITVLFPDKQNVLNKINKADSNYLCNYKEKFIEELGSVYFNISVHKMYIVPSKIDSIIQLLKNEEDTTLLDPHDKPPFHYYLINTEDKFFPWIANPLFDLMNNDMESFEEDLLFIKERIEEELNIAKSNLGIE